MIRSTSLFSILLAGGLAIAGVAQASALIVGGGMGRECYRTAKAREGQGEARPSEIAICTHALYNEALSPRDRAATFVNRGIMQMTRRDYIRAYDDYRQAVRLRPQLAEAHVNLGAALIGLDRQREGIAAIDRGLALNPEQPEKAYFNRALALEQLGDVKGAYYDYTRAAELKPGWAAPQRELARFSVSRKRNG